MFYRYDTDHSGHIDMSELAAAVEHWQHDLIHGEDSSAGQADPERPELDLTPQQREKFTEIFNFYCYPPGLGMDRVGCARLFRECRLVLTADHVLNISLIDLAFNKVAGNYARRLPLEEFWKVMAHAARVKGSKEWDHDKGFLEQPPVPGCSFPTIIRAAIRGFKNPKRLPPTEQIEWKMPRWKPRFIVLTDSSFHKRRFEVGAKPGG